MRNFRLLVLALIALALVLAGCKGKETTKKAAKKGQKVEKKEGAKAEEPAAEEESEEAAEEEEAEEEAEEEEEAEAEEEAASPTEEAAPAEEAKDGEKGDDELTDTVVAKVNGSEIDAKDYVARLKRLTKGKVTRSMLKKTVIDRMINDELLHQEIEKLKISVSDEEIAEAMNMDMERYNKQKESMAARVKAFSERVAVRKLLQARGLLAEPTDQELQKEYERRFGLKIDTVTMAVAPGATDEESAAADESAKKILEAVQTGQTLREAVKDKKDAAGRRIIVKPMFIKKGDERHKELWEAANPLEEKGIAGPVKTRHGFVVLQLAKRIEPRQPFDQMKAKLKKSAMNMKTAQAKHRLLEDLRKEAKVEYLIEFKAQQRPGTRSLKGGRLNPNLRPAVPQPLRVPPTAVRPGAGAATAPAEKPAAAAEKPAEPAAAPAEPAAAPAEKPAE